MRYKKVQKDSYPNAFVPRISNFQDMVWEINNETINAFFLRTLKHQKLIFFQFHILALRSVLNWELDQILFIIILFVVHKSKEKRCNVKSSTIYRVKLILMVHFLFSKKSKFLYDQLSQWRKLFAENFAFFENKK